MRDAEEGGARVVRLGAPAWIVAVALASAITTAAACGGRTALIASGREWGDAGPAAAPPVDAAFPDVRTCPGPALIYTVSNQGNLFTFDPSRATFSLLGAASCPTSSMPFDLAMDHYGFAWITYDSGQLFVVDTTTLICSTTFFEVGQAGFPARIALTFVVDPTTGVETLYAAGTTGFSPGSPSPFGTIDADTYVLSRIGELDPEVVAPALSTTGKGDVWVFFENPSFSSGAQVGQVSEQSGRLQSLGPVSGITSLGQGWAFAYADGAFYYFTAPEGSTVVTAVGTTSPGPGVVATYPEPMVGAAVAGCVP